MDAQILRLSIDWSLNMCSTVNWGDIDSPGIEYPIIISQLTFPVVNCMEIVKNCKLDWLKQPRNAIKSSGEGHSSFAGGRKTAVNDPQITRHFLPNAYEFLCTKKYSYLGWISCKQTWQNSTKKRTMLPVMECEPCSFESKKINIHTVSSVYGAVFLQFVTPFIFCTHLVGLSCVTDKWTQP